MDEYTETRGALAQLEKALEKDNVMDEYTEIRAALMQLEKALVTERACVIRIRKILERRLGAQYMDEDVRDAMSDSISSAPRYNTV